MKKIVALQLAIFIVALCSGRASAIQQAFLVQNSGWMEPFYVDKGSEFKPLINAVVEAVADRSQPFTILTFNQTTPENKSPTVIYHGLVTTEMKTAVDQIQLARKGVGKALADTDFNEAVFKTITGPFKGISGIIWIFTNNKNSPDNSPKTAACNRAFYDLVHADPSITRSLAFLLAMRVKGSIYAANGLMIYALAYGSEADSYLQTLVADRRLARVLTQEPAQLKPLDKDAVRLLPKAVMNAPYTNAALGPDGRTLILDIDVSEHQSVVRVVAILENLFYPYRIFSAKIMAQIEGEGWTNDLPISPENITDLTPGGASEVTVTIPIQAEVPSTWSLASLSDFGRQIRVPAMIKIRLENQKLRIDDAFRTRLDEIFPGDPLPEVFLPPASIEASTATIPILIRINYPLLPILIVATGIIALAAAAFLFFSRVRLAANYEVIVDGALQRVSLRRFASQIIHNSGGKEIGIIRRSGGSPKVQSVSAGHTLSLRDL